MIAYQIYKGSDGAATKKFYADLETRGPLGFVAMNLFRAQKCSARAKGYRRRAHKDNAYDRKNWSLKQLCQALEEHAAPLGIKFGWGRDDTQAFHRAFTKGDPVPLGRGGIWYP